ncbi:MAG TPA: MOSC domain-containing protein [Streptosporangiaceae bacterium]
METARVVSVNTGRERSASWAGGLRRTAIDKRPVAAAVQVGMLGLAGDEQADKAHHGGSEQAIYAYAREDLDWWAARLGRELRDGTFGENVATRGLDVTGAVIGEVWRLGGIVVQVTSPRIPCVVFRNWLGEKGWIKAFRLAGRPGAYLRVCQQGMLRVGDPVEVMSRPEGSVTVADALEAFYTRDAGVMRRLESVPGHSVKFDGIADEWLAAGRLPAPAAG